MVQLVEALEDIVDGNNAVEYGGDPVQHAELVTEYMRARARRAISIVPDRYYEAGRQHPPKPEIWAVASLLHRGGETSMTMTVTAGTEEDAKEKARANAAAVRPGWEIAEMLAEGMLDDR